MLFLPRFRHFLQDNERSAAGRSAPPSGMLLDFLIRDRHSPLEFFLFLHSDAKNVLGEVQRMSLMTILLITPQVGLV